MLIFYYVVQAGLELPAVLLSQSPECWDYRARTADTEVKVPKTKFKTIQTQDEFKDKTSNMTEITTVHLYFNPAPCYIHLGRIYFHEMLPSLEKQIIFCLIHILNQICNSFVRCTTGMPGPHCKAASSGISGFRVGLKIYSKASHLAIMWS